LTAAVEAEAALVVGPLVSVHVSVLAVGAPMSVLAVSVLALMSGVGRPASS
jgi:hypothetical protein